MFQTLEKMAWAKSIRICGWFLRLRCRNCRSWLPQICAHHVLSVQSAVSTCATTHMLRAVRIELVVFNILHQLTRKHLSCLSPASSRPHRLMNWHPTAVVTFCITWLSYQYILVAFWRRLLCWVIGLLYLGLGKVWACKTWTCFSLLLLWEWSWLLKLLIILLISFHILLVWRLRAVNYFIIWGESACQAPTTERFTVFAAKGLTQGVWCTTALIWSCW